MSNSHKRNQKGLAPGVRPSLRSGSLLPVPLRGHAATGHPWPIAALPASMPVDPLRRTSSRPPDGAGRSRSKAVEAADRPACLNAGFSTDISPCGSRACPRCRHLVLSGGTKCCHRGQARSHNRAGRSRRTLANRPNGRARTFWFLLGPFKMDSP